MRTDRQELMERDDRMARLLQDLIASYDLSTYRENAFEQLFCSEILQAAWLTGLPPLEIDRPFVDFVADRPSGCVVNLRPTVGGEPGRIRFSYDVFAAEPGRPLQVAGLKAAKKSVNTRQPDGEFAKVERLHHVVVPTKLMTRGLDVDGPLIRMFGEPGNA